MKITYRRHKTQRHGYRTEMISFFADEQPVQHLIFSGKDIIYGKVKSVITAIIEMVCSRYIQSDVRTQSGSVVTAIVDHKLS